MKKPIITGLILLAALALWHWGNRILEQTLDRELPKLLSSELGIAVTLAPTRTWIPTLTVRTPQLVMGDPANPALVATRVSVSLDWSDLLHGEIRLRRASGATLIVKPSLWPGNDDPWPTDYRFLDPYLPDYLALTSARYVGADGAAWSFGHPQWRRQAAAARLDWQDTATGKPVDIAVTLASLDDLLRLAELRLQVAANPAGDDGAAVTLALDIRPDKQAGYRLSAQVDAAGMTARVLSGNTRPWALPDQSSTDIKLLDVAKARALVAAYQPDSASEGAAKDATEALATRLPRLSLPVHRGHLAIGEIHWRDEVGTDTALDFVTGPHGISVPTLTSRGPEGALAGGLDVTSSDSGWELGLTAAIKAVAADRSLAAPYLDASWFWREGHASLTGKGDTWDSLLNSLQGDINLAGSHHGATLTPVNLTARLDNRPGELTLDTLAVTLGEGRITGSVSLSGDDRKRLTGNIRAQQLDLDFLLPPADPAAPPGMELPTYLEVLPGVDLDATLDIVSLSVSGFDIRQTNISFQRTPHQANLSAHARDAEGGRLDLELAARIFPDQPSEVSLRTELADFDVAKLFRQSSIIFGGRASGSISFTSRAKGIEQVFAAMTGKADLYLAQAPGVDAGGATPAGDKLRLAGEAALVLADHRITGLRISDLVVDSVLQNITGTASIVEGRSPWLEAELTSDRLDLAALLKQAPGAETDAPSSFSLDTLAQMGDSHIGLEAKSVLVAGLPLSAVSITLRSTPNNIRIEQLDFSLGEGHLASSGEVSLQDKTARFALDARVQDIRLDKILTDAPAAAGAALSGTISLDSSGDSVAGLLANLSGDIELTTGPVSGGSATTAPARIALTAKQTGNGMHAQIRQFLWEGTDLAGSVQYYATTPPLLELDISGGSLSLLPWEASSAAPIDDAGEQKTDSVAAITARTARTARTGIDLIGDVVMAPLRLISGPREAKPGDKLFSTRPLPLDWMHKYEMRLKGKLDSLTSREGTASDLAFSAELAQGRLQAQASGSLNAGSATGRMSVDTLLQPASLTLNGTFHNLRGNVGNGGFTRSGYFDINSRGQSQAALAANASGLVYLELGAGPLDYSNMMLLTADVATGVFQTLIPGVEKKQPQLDCAVTLGVFKDGIGATPYGYAARTDLANLVGNVKLDLKKELIHLNFSSSSRQGLGLSVGNVFSNTVEVEGPITDPRIIPATTGLLWRSWAAVMTGGLSVLGESVLKRALASENPCESVRKHIRKDFCGKPEAAGTAAMVCPPA